MKKTIDWLAKSNIFLYAISISIILFIVKCLVSIFKNVLKIPDIQFREELVNGDFKITISLAFDTLIFAPIFETLVFQTLFFSIFKRFKINRWAVIFLSGAAFGAIHNYSIFYMILAALVGFIFMYMYILRAEIDNKPLVSTIVAHSFANLTVTITTLITHFYKFGTWF